MSMTIETRVGDVGMTEVVASVPDEVSDEFRAFFAKLVDRDRREQVNISNSLITSATGRADWSEATVDAIRHSILALLAGPYMPTPDAIIKALYPSVAETSEFLRS